MRITATHTYRNQLETTRRKGEEAFEAQRVAGSGRRVETPSDDPVAHRRMSSVATYRGELAAARGKIDRARGELGAAESSLEEMSLLLARVKEIAVAMSSEQYNANDRAMAATEVAEIQQQLLTFGNIQVGDRYLFSGTSTDTAPFDAVGNYLGSNTNVNVNLPQNASVQVTLRGDDLLRGTSGGPDIVTVLGTLVADLTANNSAGIQAAVQTVDDSFEWVVQHRVEFAGQRSSLDSLDRFFEEQDSALQVEEETLRDADAVQAYSEFVRTQQAFEAAMQVTVGGRTPNIFELIF